MSPRNRVRSIAVGLGSDLHPTAVPHLGEEGLELALAAVAQPDEEVLGEAADLLYHAMLLLQVKNLSWARVVAELELRHRDRSR